MMDSAQSNDGTVAMPPVGDKTAAEQKPEKKAQRAHEKGAKITARTVATVGAIVLGILLVLFIVARAALYDSIFTMLGDMGYALGVIISRIFS